MLLVYNTEFQKLLAMSRKIPPFRYNKCGSPTANNNKKEEFVMKDNNSLAHSTWNCKYQLIFALKYRRKES